MTSTGAIRVEQVPWLVGIAGRAPSLHNSQPWRFCYEDGRIELHADRSRQIRFSDPLGRELVLSCGAALFTLQVAIASRGARPLVDVLPEPDRPDLLARVDLELHAPPGAAQTALFDAVYRRHTHRSGFSGRPPTSSQRAAWQRAAERHGVRLSLLDDLHARGVSARLAQQGAALQSRHPLRAAELRRWTAAESGGAREGVRASAGIPARHPFGLAGRPVGVRTASQRPTVVRDDGAVLAVLTTTSDSVPAWLSAGQALQHVLLLAGTRWFFADIDTQVLESDELRSSLARELHVSGHVQLLLALGHSPTAPLTPRRPVGELLRNAPARPAERDRDPTAGPRRG